MNDTNDHYYYHAIALATHGNYSAIKKYRENAESWEAAYHAALNESGPAVPFSDPREGYGELDRAGIRLALATEPEFPITLRHIPYPPFGIYLRGANMRSGGDTPTIAVVGTRRASVDGKKIARRFARELAAAGCAIASGLAFGVDAAAHEGALDARGTTVAVLAGGLDAVYPHSNDALGRRILANGGTLISEYPPGEKPFGYRFIERNRIISGIARGILIIEAPESSGALATARYAAEQNRELFVVPGAITAANFKGSHALIRQGAELVTSPDNILDAYDIDKKERSRSADVAASPEEILVLRALAAISAPADVDKLIALTKLEPRMLNQALSFLLIRGIIKESEAGYTI
jgi:DNA processing protein